LKDSEEVENNLSKINYNPLKKIMKLASKKILILLKNIFKDKKESPKRNPKLLKKILNFKDND
jgi:hypothetical protein